MSYRNIYKLKILIWILFSVYFSGFAYSQDKISDLVRKVQINSQRQYDNIHTLGFHGRSKSFMYMGVNAFDLNTVTSYEEYFFDGLWIKPDSLKIQISALRKVIADTTDFTQEVNPRNKLPNPMQFSHDLSIMKTYKNKTGDKVFKWAVYPFAPGADSLYNYEIVSTIKFGTTEPNMREILEIFVSPRYSEYPAVSGTFLIDSDENAVVGSSIVFNETANLARQNFKKNETTKSAKIIFSALKGRMDEHRCLKTEKVLFFSEYWLPKATEEDFFAQVGGINVRVKREIEFLSYEINPQSVDTKLLKNKKVTYRIDSTLQNKITKGLKNPERLTIEEEDRIIKESEKDIAALGLNSGLFDLDLLAQEAMKKKLEQKSSKYFQFAHRMADLFIYNRVEGPHINYGLTLSNFILNNITLTFKGGYGFKDRRPKGETAFLYFIDTKKRFFIEGNLYNTITFNEDRIRISNSKNTFSSLIFKSDYRDYYYKHGGNIGLGYMITNNCAVKLFGISHTEKTAFNNTDFSIFKHAETFRLNPEIIEGKFRELRLLLLFHSRSFNAELLTEYTDKNTLKSDFSYSLTKAKIGWKTKIKTLNSISLSMSLGISEGRLPPQRWFDFGGKSLFNYTGNLRGVGYKAFTGDRMAYGTFEYSRYFMHLFEKKKEPGRFDDFKKALKCTLWAGFGLSDLSEKNRLYAAAINTPLQTTQGGYYEFGFGIGDRFNITRIDFIRNSIQKNSIICSINFFQ